MFAAAALAASLVASAFAAPLPVALRTVEAALSLPNTTQTNTAYYYYRELTFPRLQRRSFVVLTAASPSRRERPCWRLRLVLEGL